MNFYFDTSAIVKWYVDEQHSQEAKGFLEQASLVFTSRVAYAEACAAFTKVHHDSRLSTDDHENVINEFSVDWPNFVVKDADESLVQRAGQYASDYGIRGFDAIHLSTAVFFDELIESGLNFVAYDKKLTAGADEVGLEIAV